MTEKFYRDIKKIQFWGVLLMGCLAFFLSHCGTKLYEKKFRVEKKNEKTRTEESRAQQLKKLEAFLEKKGNEELKKELLPILKKVSCFLLLAKKFEEETGEKILKID